MNPCTPPDATDTSLSAAAGLALGRPRFADARLAQVAAERGGLAAWRAALAAAGPSADAAAAVAAAVGGDFAVGLADAAGRG